MAGATPNCDRRRALATAAIAALAAPARVIALASPVAMAPLPTVRAQPRWPTKPIHVIVPYPAGGNADAIRRFVADRLGAALGQPIVVENKAGAGASIGTGLAAQAAADGYTLLVAPIAVFTSTHHLRRVRTTPGSADAVNALAGGQVDFVIDGAVVALARSGRVRAVAVFGNQKHPGLPELPTLDEAGIPVRTQRTSSWGLFAPKGIPTEVNVRLAEALKTAMARPEIRERFTRTSTLPDWRSPAEDLRAAMDSDYRFNGELLPAMGIRPEE